MASFHRRRSARHGGHRRRRVKPTRDRLGSETCRGIACVDDGRVRSVGRRLVPGQPHTEAPAEHRIDVERDRIAPFRYRDWLGAAPQPRCDHATPIKRRSRRITPVTRIGAGSSTLVGEPVGRSGRSASPRHPACRRVSTVELIWDGRGESRATSTGLGSSRWRRGGRGRLDVRGLPDPPPTIRRTAPSGFS